jgi:hypothetical protein
MICTAHQILFQWSNQEKWYRKGMKHVWGAADVHTGFWWGILRERGKLKDTVGDGILLKCMLKKPVRRAWAGFFWLGIGIPYT